MGFVVLAFGALMVIAGAYEMVAGSGDILSERGWSAFVAGAVLVGTGVVTAALGLVLRTLQAVRDAIRASVVVSEPVMAAADRFAVPAASGPSLEPAHSAESGFEPAPTAPLIAAAPLAHSLVDSVPPMPNDHHVEHGGSTEAAANPSSAIVEEDWLDHSFAELEREIADKHPAPPREAVPVEETSSPAQGHAASNVGALEPSPAHPTHELEWPAEVQHHQPDHDPVPVAHDPVVVHEPVSAPAAAPVYEDPPATRVSAREDTTSPVIGRYESEGTSYVMYADGSIDAQSEAGVYRFASMAELKAFIES